MSQLVYKRFFTANALSYQRVHLRKRTDIMRFLIATIFAALVIVIVISTYLWSRLAVVNLGYEISSVNRERSKLEDENKRLRFELLTLKSPKRIEKIARDDIGLIYPSAKHIVYIR
jgi:cell division protein FtsL